MELIVEKSKEGTKLREILSAALKLFVAKGINATSIKDIAAEAKVSEGALYRHFKSKDELAWYIFSVHLNEFSINLLAKISKEADIKNKIKVFVSVCLNAFESNRDLFTFMIIHEHRELSKFTANYMHPGLVALKLIEEGQSSGELKKIDRYVLASILLGTLIRLCAVKIYGTITENLANYEDEVAEAIYKALI